MTSGHLHEVERDVVLEQELCELPRRSDQTILGAAIEVDVRQLLGANLMDQREGIVGIRLLSGQERLALRITLCRTAESLDADCGIGPPLTRIPGGLLLWSALGTGAPR